MESIIVHLNSVVAHSATNTPAIKFNELRQLARKETVEIIFKDDWCRIIARHSRKVKVPKKAIASSDGLVKWIEERIKSAWK
ncbi:hypothetical protein [Prevotella sp. KH2C16]|uniref:hypothetical protein n=1 Tax=Prevotella sp. KH2C16 TaxID=1855325 RepID=UPI00116082FA|nr:hypothetical protein [Prevotella sp. KH2C16]